MLVGRHYVISGRVQRVGYRYFVCDAAHREGVNGWVRNLADGQVEVEVEGDLEAVDRFERSIRQGPAGARVDEVDVAFLPPRGRHAGFLVGG